MVNYYSVLKVSPTSSEEEIKKALNKELRIWSNRTNAPQIERRQEAERMVKLLEEAENTLLNSAKRAEYDRQFKAAPKDERSIDDAELTGKGDTDLVQQAWNLLISGNVADALYVATKATQVQGNNPEAWAVLGQAKFRWNETDDAIYEYKRAIQLKPNEPSYYFDLGSIYESIERWKDALQQYQRASQIDPRSAMYRAAIGILFIKNEMFKEGIDILERCVQEEPENDTYQWFLAMAYVECTYQNWTFIPEGQNLSSGFYATEKEHVEEAKHYIEKAEKLRFNDPELSAHIRSVKENVHSMFQRKFYGNWLVSGIWFLVGLFALGQGGTVPGLLMMGIAGFYVYASRPPQFLLNRKIIKGQSPSGGFDGILWVILFYPFMAIWNYYNNYIKLGPLSDAEATPSIPFTPSPEREKAQEKVDSGSARKVDETSSPQAKKSPNVNDETIIPEKEVLIPPSSYKQVPERPRVEHPFVAMRTNNNKMTFIVGALAGILIIIGGYFAYDYFYVKKNFLGKIGSALSAGRYFSPPIDNVEEIFKAQKTKAPDSKELKEATDKIRLKFGQEGDAAFQRFYNDSDDMGWENIVRMYSFLREIIPEDREIQARAEFTKAHNIIKGGRRSDYSEALSRYQKALELKPNWVLAINGLAKVYVRKNSPFYNKLEALNYYNRACQIDPNFPWAYTNIAAIYAEDRNWEMAEQTLQRALNLKRDRSSILIDLGNLCEKQQKTFAARNYYQEAIKFEKNPDKINWLQKKISSVQ